MICRPEPGLIIKAKSRHEWEFAFQEIEKYGICGLILDKTGQDPLSHEIKTTPLSFPNSISSLAGLLVLRRIKKVLCRVREWQKSNYQRCAILCSITFISVCDAIEVQFILTQFLDRFLR